MAAAAALLLTAFSGCGSDRPGVLIDGDQLTVVTSAPLSGELQDAGQAMVNGERLALADAGGMAGPFTVSLMILNSVQGQMKLSSEAQVASNARAAVLAPTSIAYIGDYESSATAISLPLTNQGGIAELSPLSAYGGFTSSEQAGADEPRRFYPSGKRTFVRLVPSQLRETTAQAALQGQQKCRASFVAYSDSPLGKSSAKALSAALKRNSVSTAGSAASSGKSSDVASFAQQVKASGADCLAYGGPINMATAELFNRLITTDSSLRFFTGRGGDSAPFTENLSARAQRATLITGPGPDPEDLGVSGAAFSKRYRAQFGTDPGVPGLYGYEAMAAVLGAIRRSGSAGNNRLRVIAALNATARRDSVLGSYSIGPDGDSTLNSFTVSRVVGGQLVVSQPLTAAIAN
ncbi:unannotated protein [freshwater metagenome]|uniref:Unannotated protein n=1 Tax=freshwater metagenome TaxID=449393 RepID=A0A6J5ZYZ2_9ZZZZ